MNGPISVIKYHGGLVAGDPLWIELWTPGTTHIIKEKKWVDIIQSILKEWQRMVKRNPNLEDDDGKGYLRWKKVIFGIRTENHILVANGKRYC